jgi:hypothetical protein
VAELYFGHLYAFMKRPLIALVLASTILSGCVTGPAISKSAMGNLDVYVTAPEGVNVHAARIRVDNIFVGNVSRDLPVLYLRRGRHTITVELAGMKTYQQEIEILGEPNHQFLEVGLERQ